mmetsp:Transcript_84937/g.263832  ORF Transcript_84937/g.263832 Transcript_84937/m.263832 type:complete len:103 (-) Transcript_84937:702-1010(-)
MRTDRGYLPHRPPCPQCCAGGKIIADSAATSRLQTPTKALQGMPQGVQDHPLFDSMQSPGLRAVAGAGAGDTVVVRAAVVVGAEVLGSSSANRQQENPSSAL